MSPIMLRAWKLKKMNYLKKTIKIKIKKKRKKKKKNDFKKSCFFSWKIKKINFFCLQKILKTILKIKNQNLQGDVTKKNFFYNKKKF